MIILLVIIALVVLYVSTSGGSTITKKDDSLIGLTSGYSSASITTGETRVRSIIPSDTISEPVSKPVTSTVRRTALDKESVLKPVRGTPVSTSSAQTRVVNRRG
jgi:hypothetical protein